jgi:hypothetical protein
MLIGLHDAERDNMPYKTFPNLALMKISAWHKKQGDTVEWHMPLESDKYDRVYSSKVFDFTPVNAYLPLEKTIKGGTGYGLYAELPKEIDKIFPDYSIYPECDYAIGFLTRGCIRTCEWCVVPRKEGLIRKYCEVGQIARSDTNKIVFMDNNVLAHPHGVEQIKLLGEAPYNIDFNQGLDVRLLTERIIDYLARCRWTKYIRFSCDTENQLSYFERFIPYFSKCKLESRLFIYLLVRKDVYEAERRVRALSTLSKSISIYAQAERQKDAPSTAAMLEFANRYIYGRSYKKETWQEYCLKRSLIYE